MYVSTCIYLSVYLSIYLSIYLHIYIYIYTHMYIHSYYMYVVLRRRPARALRSPAPESRRAARGDIIYYTIPSLYNYDNMN